MTFRVDDGQVTATFACQRNLKVGENEKKRRDETFLTEGRAQKSVTTNKYYFSLTPTLMAKAHEKLPSDD